MGKINHLSKSHPWCHKKKQIGWKIVNVITTLLGPRNVVREKSLSRKSRRGKRKGFSLSRATQKKGNREDRKKSSTDRANSKWKKARRLSETG